MKLSMPRQQETGNVLSIQHWYGIEKGDTKMIPTNTSLYTPLHLSPLFLLVPHIAPDHFAWKQN